MSRTNRLTLGLILLIAACPGRILADDPPRSISIFLVGDSTVKNGSGKGEGDLWGWGDFLQGHFDPAKARVVNRAIGGRSSRTFFTEGRWEKVVAELRPGDYVLIQFGHNDGGPIETGRARASLKGVGEESKEFVVETTKKAETVHTFGWYLRRYVSDARAKGAIPVLLSPVPRNTWNAEGKVNRASKDYGQWAAEVARSESIDFIDLNEIAARHYEDDGQPKVAATYFTKTDHTHTTEAGAKLNAKSVVEGIRASLKGPIVDSLITATDKK